MIGSRLLHVVTSTAEIGIVVDSAPANDDYDAYVDVE